MMPVRFLTPFLLIAMAAGCGGGLEKFPTAATKGKVVCDGKPVPFAMVFFEPKKSGGSAIVGKAGFAETDENGEFVLSTYGNKDGAVVGNHRVKVDKPSREDHPDFSCDCELNDIDTVTEVAVMDGSNNEFTIELPSKKRRRGGREQLTEEEQEELEDG